MISSIIVINFIIATEFIGIELSVLNEYAANKQLALSLFPTIIN